MLNFQDLVLQYPPQLQGFQRYILREYLQYKLLAIVSQSDQASKLAFIGGTALRIVHQNSRFSEDIDFDNFNLTDADFDNLTRKIQNELSNEGFVVEMRNVHKGAYRCYIRFPELLFKLGLTPIEEEKILIQLDSASHDFPYIPDTFVLNKFDVFTPIRVTPIDILLSQKLFAALDRKTPKGRDFYDITFLLGKTKPNYKYLKAKLQVDNSQDLRKLFQERIKKMNFTEMALDVQKFLFNPKDSQRVELFTKYFATVELD